MDQRVPWDQAIARPGDQDEIAKDVLIEYSVQNLVRPPLAIGIITESTGSNRLGVACVLFFLVLGFVLLWGVRKERAQV